MTLSHEDVQEILALLDELDATELHLRTRHFALSLRRDGTGGGWVQASAVPARSDPPPATGPETREPEAEPAEVAGLVAVRAPLMGTFYRAPKPGAPPFVAVGDQVDVDTVVGIIETMKLMNSVYAGTRGRVAEICLANAAPAAQGAVLLRIALPDPAEQ